MSHSGKEKDQRTPEAGLHEEVCRTVRPWHYDNFQNFLAAHSNYSGQTIPWAFEYPSLTPLQYFCLENPVDGGAWWAAVHGVTRVRHNWATSLSLFTFMHWRRKWQPTPVFLPGESQGQEAWLVAVSGVTQSRTWLKRRSISISIITYSYWPS